ncbi:histidine kinase [Paenibacillus sp. TRM 82003]|uniref:sensor histidine kinase n=1 Tax=Kineococcus sp. TRM81007 TaxID=2925831 RepID=UPI001F5AD3CA|nr:histidine kinase [Kineococcus sp. TRM81007]MCI2237343.1 histidine kinase [Kineococcus sp. TRM81007]MCI3926550.1 histidine kinase [Paenibacillus sp. TRM 82003]
MSAAPPPAPPVSPPVRDPRVARWPFAPRLRDLLAIALSLLVAVVWFSVQVEGPVDTAASGYYAAPLDLSHVGAADVVLLLVVLASCASLWWRRSYPVAVTVASIAVALLVAFDGAMFFALLTLAVRRRDRLLVLLAVLGFLSSVTAAARTTLDGWGFSVFTAALGTALVVFVGAYVGARRALVCTLWERAERAEQEQSLRAEQARLAERTRIAREMHDVLAHRISLVALHAGGLEVRPDVGPEQVETTAATIRETARTALEDLRRVLGVLRTPGSGTGAAGSSAATAAELAPQPTLVDVRRLVESSREAGVAAQFRTDVPVHADVPAELGRTVYRVVQEALTNVHKHAPSAPTVVTISGEVGRELIVSVVNARPDGQPSGLPGAGSGLVGLSERVGFAEGTIRSGPEPGGGFAVRAQLPWPLPEGRSAQRTTAAWTPPDARLTPAPVTVGRGGTSADRPAPAGAPDDGRSAAQ